MEDPLPIHIFCLGPGGSPFPVPSARGPPSLRPCLPGLLPPVHGPQSLWPAPDVGRPLPTLNHSTYVRVPSLAFALPSLGLCVSKGRVCAPAHGTRYSTQARLLIEMSSRSQIHALSVVRIDPQHSRK